MKDQLLVLALVTGIGLAVFKLSETGSVMEKTKKKGKQKKNKSGFLKKDPRTGMPILSGGPSFTKEDIAKEFPKDSDRDSAVIRSSVGL